MKWCVTIPGDLPESATAANQLGINVEDVSDEGTTVSLEAPNSEAAREKAAGLVWAAREASQQWLVLDYDACLERLKRR
jgi:hypothetical protein